MQHHRFVLNGPPGPVAALARDLHAAGAVPVHGSDPPRFTWTTPPPSPLVALCARHPEATVGVERFADLGATLDHLVLQGRETTVLERLPLRPTSEDGPPLALPEDGAPLPPAGLLAAAERVAAEPVRLLPAPTASALDDALLVGIAAGRLCAAAGAELPSGDPPDAALDALAALAAAGLTAGAAVHDPADAGEMAFERARVLAEAHGIAAAERVCSRPGAADWPEWLLYVLVDVATVLEDCAVAVHEPPPPGLALYVEHGSTVAERLGYATTRLVASGLQVLTLFAGTAAVGPGGCARN
jgi:hypothetical protein